jgi:leader peptidase (prepilin peptidase)/N-methyltransferase
MVLLLVVMIIGAILGSFANVCIHRIPRKESIVYPPSHCPQCGTNLRALDLVPLLSFLWLRGRCRYCKVMLPVRYFLVELLISLGFAGLWIISDGVGEFIWYAGNFFILLVLGAIDIEHFILPNSLIIIGVLFSLIFSLFGFGPGIICALSGALIGFAILAVIGMASGGKMGAGDMKLLAYIGTLVGCMQVFVTLFLASFFGVLVHMSMIVFTRRNVRGQMIPFGPYLAAAAMVCMVFGERLLEIWLG